jgi:anti-anti-sigma factor
MTQQSEEQLDVLWQCPICGAPAPWVWHASCPACPVCGGEAWCRKRMVEDVAILSILPVSLPEPIEINRLVQVLRAASAAPRVVADLSALDYIRSSALAGLIYFQQRLNEGQGRIMLCGLVPLVRETFRRTRLDTLFEIRGTADQALRALQPRANVDRCPSPVRHSDKTRSFVALDRFAHAP